MIIPPSYIIVPEPLGELEAAIAGYMRAYPLEEILIGLRIALTEARTQEGVFAEFRPFTFATAARFALRFGTPSTFESSMIKPIDPNVLIHLLRMSMTYSLADPSTWDPSVPHSTLSIMVRHVGNQFPFDADATGKWGRAQLLFNEVPGEIAGRKGVPTFDFHSEFERTVGTTVTNFIDTCYVAYAASQGQMGFTRSYFDKARIDGMLLPSDAIIKSVLDNIAADHDSHARLINEWRQPDRRYAAYDANSLMDFPLIRPWPGRSSGAACDDRLLAVIPELITFRLSTGIYYQMRKAYKSAFLEFFGHMFSEYVGRLLQTFATHRLLSERQLRQTYPSSSGKVPDWVVVDGATAILVECKAVRVQRRTYVQGDEDDLRESVRQVVGGIGQLFEFCESVKNHHPGLEQLHHCSSFVPLVVTWEPFYLASSTFFKQLIKDELEETIRSMEFAVLSLDELEWLQVHLCSGLGIGETLRHTLTHTASESIQRAHGLSGLTYGGSFLCQKEQELSERLGIPPDRPAVPVG